MTTYVENEVFLTPFQFGFLSRVSLEESDLYFIETIRLETENGDLFMQNFWNKPMLLTHYHIKSYRKHRSH